MEIRLSRKVDNKGNKLDACQVQNCIDSYLAGTPIGKIAQNLGFKQDVIIGALKRNGIKVYPRNTRKTEEFTNYDALFEDYANGKSLIQLSNSYNLDAQSIKRILVKKGLYKTPANQKVNMTDDHLLTAISLAKQGVAYKDIGLQLGYSVWVINRSLVTAGITRTKGEANLANYQSQVRRLTNINYNQYKNQINPFNLPRGKKSYHIDHIYSVYEGFTNQIPAHIIAHPANLQMLSYDNNISKRTRSYHTLEELLNKIKQFDQ